MSITLTDDLNHDDYQVGDIVYADLNRSGKKSRARVTSSESCYVEVASWLFSSETAVLEIEKVTRIDPYASLPFTKGMNDLVAERVYLSYLENRYSCRFPPSMSTEVVSEVLGAAAFQTFSFVRNQALDIRWREHVITFRSWEEIEVFCKGVELGGESRG